MSEEKKERPKIDEELKKELLEQTKDSGIHGVEERAAALEGKIPLEKKKKEE